MKSKLYLLFLLCAPVLFIACDDETETFQDRWRIENEAQFERVTADPNFRKRESLTGNGHIMYRIIESGDESGRFPYFTDRVRLNYTGWLKNDWTRPPTFTNDRGHTIRNQIIFDTTIDDRGNERPRTLSVNGVIQGFSDALQHMRPGDKWEVWIPWNLGYGQQDIIGTPIRGFSTLVFEIELLNIL